jgi:hypothetical protein
MYPPLMAYLVTGQVSIKSDLQHFATHELDEPFDEKEPGEGVAPSNMDLRPTPLIALAPRQQ